MITVLLLVLLVLAGLILFLLLSPLRIELDTSAPFGRARWWGIGRAELYHDKEWTVKLRVLFFRRVYYPERIKWSRATKKQKNKRKREKHHQPGMPFRVMLKKIRRVFRSFIIENWQLAVDTGDATLNAKLYPLNWIPAMQGHLLVNFNGEQYFRCRIRNTGWRLLRAWYRR